MGNPIVFSFNGVNPSPGTFTFTPPNYPGTGPGVPFAWSDEPNAVIPPSSYFTPNTKPPAPVLNYIFSQIATDLVTLSQFTNKSSASTTVSALSNGVSLPQTVVNVQSTIGFATSGTIFVLTSSGVQAVAYTNVTDFSFTGCTGGSGTMSTNNAVGGVNALGASWGMNGTGAGGTQTSSGAAAGAGIVGTGGLGSNTGVAGFGAGTGAGVTGTGASAFSALGGLFTGSGTGAGVSGTGGNGGGLFAGAGGAFQGGASGNGVQGSLVHPASLASMGRGMGALAGSADPS